jgi:hypothetical protein
VEADRTSNVGVAKVGRSPSCTWEVDIGGTNGQSQLGGEYRRAS